MTLSEVDSIVKKLGIQDWHQMRQESWLSIVSSGRSIQLVKRDVAEAEGWVDSGQSWNITSPARVFFSGARQLSDPLQQGVYTSR